MLRSDRLRNYLTKINSANLTATRVKRGRWSMSLLVAKTGRSSVRELTLNCVSITNSAALSNTFNDNFSTIGSKLASEIPFNNGSSFQEHISGLCERFQLVSTDSNQVLCLFKKLNKPKGAGLDLIAPQISILFNSSLAWMVYFLTIGSLRGLLLYLSMAKEAI